MLGRSSTIELYSSHKSCFIHMDEVLICGSYSKSII